MLTIIRTAAIFAIISAPFVGVAAAGPNGCQPGGDCFARRVIAEQQHLDQLQRNRELRQKNLNRARDLRSNPYSGYRDDSIPAFRPRAVQPIPSGPIFVNPRQN